MEQLLIWFKSALLACGLAIEALVLLSCGLAAWWLILRFADWRGQWMDEHPEEAPRRGGKHRQGGDRL